MKNCFLATCFSCLSVIIFAQKTGVQLLATKAPSTVSFRGMSFANDDVLWLSGTEGTVGKSIDGGKSFFWINVKGYETKDFRDIHAFDENTAIVMAVGNPAVLLKTKDGGLTWKEVFTYSADGMFLDAMDFRNDKEGVCIGDPITVGSAGRRFFFVIKTFDGGDTWKQEPLHKLPPAEKYGEALFAASGTNIKMFNNSDYDYVFATGGVVSNIYFMAHEGKTNKAMQVPINQGIESTGVFSIAVDGDKKVYCIGGDYKIKFSTYDNFYWTTDGGKKWASPAVAPPFGYRSCIALIDKKTMVACGINGVDICRDGGHEWFSVTTEGFNVCMVSPTKKVVFLAGDKGKIGILKY